ncbi:MAG: diguanylate cyclase (GGDEF)-like protein/PAS domain S-box-containing protein [Janthinobacterium sp.]|jgi:diguanylate cyclase (GGDEF)-like protein/PAS domain S-box-containing protein
MSQAPLPSDETARLALLHSLDLLDTSAEPFFDRITRLAAIALQVPIALISLVDTQRQWFKSRVGLSVCETPRASSFCAHAILQQGPFIVADTLGDARFCDNPLVTAAPNIRFYAGMSLLTQEGKALGTLCVIDTVPRTLQQAEIDALVDLAALVSDEIQQREAALLARRHIDLSNCALAQSEARFRSIFERALVGIAMAAPDGSLIRVNDAYCDIVDYRHDDLVGLHFQDITHADDIDVDLRLLQRMRDGSINRYQVEKRYLRKNGAAIWVSTSVTGVMDANGKLDYLITIVEDIDARKKALAALRHDLEMRVEQRTQELSAANEKLSCSMQQQQHFQHALAKREAELSAVIENANDAYVCIDQKGVISAWNQQAQEVFGWSASEAIGCMLDELIVPPDLRAAHRAGMQRYLHSGASTLLTRRIELPAIRRDGRSLPMEVRIQALTLDGVTIFSAFLHDISERKLAEQTREQEARHDLLTGLPNRRALFEMLPLALARAERNRTALVLFFLDLDGFKQVNDVLGHEAGDRVLCEVSSRLSDGLRKMDSVARLAGDEFTVLLEGLSADGQADALRIAEKLLACLQQPVVIASTSVQVSASIGIAFHLPDSAISADSLLKIADTAMYEAKRAGKSMIRMK